MNRINSICSVLVVLMTNFSHGACTGKVDAIQQNFNGRISLESLSLYGDSSARDICRLDT